MVLVIGPNLAIDSTVAVPRLHEGTIHRVPAIVKLAGGKGANLARALRILGGEPLLIGFAGGPAGAQLRAYLAADGIPARLVAIAAETRACFSVCDEATGAQTEFYEAGAPISEAEIAELLAVAEAAMAETATAETAMNGVPWVACTGSLPQGAPVDIYGELIARARHHGARTLLDAKGAVLTAALAVGPDLLKINRGELADRVKVALPTPAVVADAAAHVVDMAAGHAALITLGAAGAVLVAPEGCWLIAPPAGLGIVSPVGSGDATAAGLLAGIVRGLPVVDAARLGVAAGTASALHLGASRFTRVEAEELVAACTVSPWTADGLVWYRPLDR